jgi:hypothetical protein
LARADGPQVLTRLNLIRCLTEYATVPYGIGIPKRQYPVCLLSVNRALGNPIFCFGCDGCLCLCRLPNHKGARAIVKTSLRHPARLRLVESGIFGECRDSQPTRPCCKSFLSLRLNAHGCLVEKLLSCFGLIGNLLSLGILTQHSKSWVQASTTAKIFLAFQCKRRIIVLDRQVSYLEGGTGCTAR